MTHENDDVGSSFCERRRGGLVIVATEPFPIGMAATNRILSYAKVLARSKPVNVLIPRPTDDELNPVNAKAAGMVGSVQFEYTNRSSVWPFRKGAISKLWVMLIGVIGLLVRLIQLRPRAVIVYSSRSYIRSVLVFMRSFLGYALVCEENEYPKILKKTKDKTKIKRALSFYRKCDGMIVMTQELKSYYASLMSSEPFHLPMTVDLDRFSGVHGEADVPYEKYFVYVGGGGGWKRDGIKEIVEAFYIFHCLYADYGLVIVGPFDTNGGDYTTIAKFIKDKDISESVLLVGSRPSDEVPRYLAGSAGILMAPQSDYSSGGFPTKLGEFLASGRPVVTTSVSEIPLYLNSSNSFIVKPGSNQGFAEMMMRIASDVEGADRIGREGRAVAEMHFAPHGYSERLIKYLGL